MSGLQTVWVECPEHGKVRAAMKGGLDNRCSECVSRALARACENMVPAPFAKRPGVEIFKTFGESPNRPENLK